MTDLHYRPTAAELVAAVAEFLDTDVRAHTEGSTNFHARVAANALRIVERELRDGTPHVDLLGFADEPALAAVIRDGGLDDHGHQVESVLRELVARRLAVAHPGYENE